MSLTELDKPELTDEHMPPSVSKYILLETQIIESDDYQPPDDYADTYPVARDIVEILRDIDLNTTRDWLWEDTFLNEHYTRGPMLVELEQDSPLIDYFWGKVSEINAGVLITTAFKRQQLLEHLKSVMTVLLPDSDQVQLKLQAPVKLVGVFGAFSDIRLSSLLGPIKNVYWTENCGPNSRYYKTTNPTEHAPKHSEPKWFQISAEELQHINDYDLAHFKKSILNTVQAHIDSGEYNGKPLTHLETLEAGELENIVDKGMQSADSVEFEEESYLHDYITYNILDPYFFKQEHVTKLINNTQLSERERIQRVQQLIERQG